MIFDSDTVGKHVLILQRITIIFLVKSFDTYLYAF